MAWIYTSMQTYHLLNTLNNEDKEIRELVRSFLFLDRRRHMVPVARESESHFHGISRKPSRKLDTHCWFWGLVGLARSE